MTIRHKKSVFSLRDMPVKTSRDCIKRVGLLIDNQLSQQPHIQYISTRLSKVIYLLRNLKNCVPFNLVRSKYLVFFQSIMSSGILFGGNVVHVRDVLILHKTVVVRVITVSAKLEHCYSSFAWIKYLTTFINLYFYHVLINT